MSANLNDVGVWGKREGADLRKAKPGTSCFSKTNLKYFYEMYQSAIEISPRVEDKIKEDIVFVPWGTIILLLPGSWSGFTPSLDVMGFYCFYV